MNRDNLEGGFRSAIGQGEKIVGNAMGDKGTAAQGAFDDAAGKARSALGSAKDAVSQSVDAVSSLDLSALRDQVTNLTQMVSDIAQKQVGAASDSLSQSASVAQDKLVASAGDVESRIKKNPWGAVAIAALVGLLIGKMS